MDAFCSATEFVCCMIFDLPLSDDQTCSNSKADPMGSFFGGLSSSHGEATCAARRSAGHFGIAWIFVHFGLPRLICHGRFVVLFIYTWSLEIVQTGTSLAS